jgi:hypothetical protein
MKQIKKEETKEPVKVLHTMTDDQLMEERLRLVDRNAAASEPDPYLSQKLGLIDAEIKKRDGRRPKPLPHEKGYNNKTKKGY